MDYRVHGILQARILEWVAFPSSRGSPRDQPRSLTLQVDSLPAEPQGKPSMGVPIIGQTMYMELPVRTWQLTFKYKRFPGSSAGKESACNVGDLGLIPGSGRSSGEGIGYPLQYSWASLVAQMVKNPPAMWETWVQSLGWEDPPERGKAPHSSSL